jgi:glutamate-ammonia-ligase adenylyltransferase
VAGDLDLGERFLVMIDAVRYPAGGISAETVQEIRRIKARVDAERLPRGPIRTPTPSWAAAGWPTSNGPCSSCSCGSPTRFPPCTTPRRWRRWTPSARPS